MIVKCTEKDRLALVNFLNTEPINNTFFISDVGHYGFDMDFQKVYMSVDEEGECLFAYLAFHNVLILAGHVEHLQKDMILRLLKDDIDVIMGKDSLLSGLSGLLAEDFEYSRKMIYKLVNDRSLPVKSLTATTASISDAREIYDFLNTIPEFKGMYASQAMIDNRIAGNEGTHIFYSDKGKIIAHGNTAATTAGSCFIGGVATHKTFRHQGYAKRIVAQLSRDALKSGRYPCLMNTPQKNSLFDELGFREHGRWGTLRRK